MRWYGVLLSLLLGLRPWARHPSACVRLGDLSGVAQINLVLKTVRYYPQTEEWREPLGWWTLSEGTFHLFRSTLQGYESIDCRPLTVIWDYLPDWPWYPLRWNFVKMIIWLIFCTTLVVIVAYLVMITSTRTWAKIWKVRTHYLAAFWQTNPLAKSLAWLEVKSFF
jgi:hypothetical protein